MLDIGKLLAPGLSHEFRVTVTTEEAVGNFSPKLDQLLATSACVKAFIRVAIEATDKYLPEGYITVGQSIEIIHEVPSYLGTTVSFKATMQGIDGNKIFYDLVAWDHMGTVATGKHTRAVVNWELLMNGARERAYMQDQGL
ncbi:MAG: thioesterase [Thermovirgaceae bacterium]|jgi:predicted thioesterase|nr:thioesterase [Synergistales bacterium]MDY0178892.1 thioesterase [Synergistaceae bacterium]MDD3830979.1 thioesterase [Synergistales bacterium]MDD4023554.1 thioesterase [Synergistales bacterium]NLV64300.1 thioesterase [Synergistaceae bacterium]